MAGLSFELGTYRAHMVSFLSNKIGCVVLVILHKEINRYFGTPYCHFALQYEGKKDRC